jgi:RHS repeat-associated protein
LIYPGGRNVYYTYDSNNHMTSVTDWSGRVTTINYDLNGRLTSVTRPNGTSRIISYDSAGDITNILDQMANGLPIALMRYNWDQASRMSLDFIAPLPHTNAPPSRSMTYNADNELATFQGPTMGSPQSLSDDADGNLTYGPLTNDNFVTYTYDVRHRLENVGAVTNIYDAMNNRIGQTYGTNSVEYVTCCPGKLPIVLERIQNGVTTYYIYGVGLLYQIAEAPTGTNTLSYHYDYRGSTIALTGDNGLVTDRMEYSVYGTMTYHAGTNNTPFLFAGRYGVQTDPDGLLYMEARYYNPYICRFLNPDPSAFKGGLNFYAYANGNPASLIDPVGLDATPIVTQVGTITANGDNITFTPSSSASPYGNPATGSSLYGATSTALNVGGIVQTVGEFGTGNAVVGLYNSSATSSGLYFNSSFWGGNQYVDTMPISEIAHSAGPILFVGSTLVDAYGYSQGNISGEEFGLNTGFGVVGVAGGPVGAVTAVSYGATTLINSTTAGSNYFNNVGQTVISNQQISPYSDNFPVFAPY